MFSKFKDKSSRTILNLLSMKEPYCYQIKKLIKYQKNVYLSKVESKRSAIILLFVFS